jgi:chemotaxis protein CheX
MNKNIIEAFSNSFLNVMPQLGLMDVRLISEEECGKKINTPGVVIIIGIVGDLHGNIIFAMGENSAKMIASIMMGMSEPAEVFDEMSQSAVSELSNMLTANASIELAGNGITTDISTPTLMYGEFTTNASFESVIKIELLADGMPFYIYVSLEQK